MAKFLDQTGVETFWSKSKQTFLLKGETAAKSTLTGGIQRKDTRSDNSAPSIYYGANTLYTEFKQTSTIGLSGATSEYCSLVNIIPWSDNSGGSITQIAIYDNQMYMRYGKTSWSGWTKFVSEGDMSNYTYSKSQIDSKFANVAGGALMAYQETLDYLNSL